MFSSFGVKPPASGFQSYSYSSLKIAPSVTSRAVLSSLFIFASSVCKSLWCLTSTLTQGGEGSHLFRFTCSVVLWGGRNTGNKYHWHVWECLQYMDHTGFAPVHSGVCFPGLHCSGSSVLFRALSKAGPEFCALPRSKQVRRPGAYEHTVPGRLCVLITSPISAARFPGVPREHQLRCAMCLFWQLFSDCDPPGGCQPSRIPGRRG